MNGETQLQIVVTAVNDAAGALENVGESLSTMQKAATEAATSMSTDIQNSLTTSEEAIAEAAQASLSQWEDATTDIEDAFANMETPISEVFSSLVSTNAEAAAAVSEVWKEQSKAIEADLAAALSVDDAAAAGEEAGTAAAEGFGGYFKEMILGYALDQIGTFLSGGIESAVASASKNGNQISTLTAQIDQQKASIAVNEAALQKWVGTTAQVNARTRKSRRQHRG